MVYEGRETVTKLSCNTVYSSLLADGETVRPDEGSAFIAAGISKIPTKGLVSFVFRPYAVTNGGAICYGAWAGVSFDDMQANRLGIGIGDCEYDPWDSIFQ